MKIPQHQYIERYTRRVMTERLYGDRIISYLYNSTREQSPALFKALTSPRMSDLLSMVNYELPTLSRLAGAHRFVERLGIDLSECVEPARAAEHGKKNFRAPNTLLGSAAHAGDPDGVVSPADGRVLVGSLAETSQIFLKEKFFNLDELLGWNRSLWLQAFSGGDFAVFRLTPDKYHYNHMPVSGRVLAALRNSRLLSSGKSVSSRHGCNALFKKQACGNHHRYRRCWRHGCRACCHD